VDRVATLTTVEELLADVIDGVQGWAAAGLPLQPTAT